MRFRLPGMRYTKLALALFGLGLVCGFVAVVIEGMPLLERAAAIAMALGIVALPLALFADGRGLVLLAWIAARLRRRSTRQKKRPARGRSGGGGGGGKRRAAKPTTASPATAGATTAKRKPAARRSPGPTRRKRS